MTAAALFRQLRRESRGSRGRLVFFVACLAVGVAAVVAVAGLAESIDAGIRGEARTLLGADLVVEARRPIPAEVAAAIGRVPGARRTETRELVSVVAAPAAADGAPGKSLLVELKAVGEGYPFYGTPQLDPARPLSELVGGAEDGAVVAPEVLTRLALAPGGTLLIGGRPFTIRGVVTAEPDKMSVGLSFGPRVFISLAGLERTNLRGFGARVEHRTLVKLPDDAGADRLAAAAEAIRAAVPAKDGAFRVETWRDALPALREALRRAARFLGLVALLSLLVGGIGVAETVRAWLAGRIEAIAVLKCLGMRPREVFVLYAAQTALLGLAGSVAGCLAGIAVQYLVPYVAGDLLPRELVQPWQPSALLRGLLLGLGVALLFSLPPLFGLRRVSPARVLRQSAEPLPQGRGARLLTIALLAAGVAVVASAQAASWRQGVIFTLGLGAAAALLAGAGWLLAKAVAGAGRRRAPFWLRHGLAALGRPNAGTLGAVVALGIGVLVVLGMYLQAARMHAYFEGELPASAPTAFLVDIQPDQWPGIERLLQEAGAERIDSAPFVTAWLRSVDGVPVEEIAKKQVARAGGEGRGEPEWALTREQRLTYRAALPAGNRLLEGQLFAVPGVPEASVEKEFAARMGATLGSKLVFDVQGVPLELSVTSLREVEWRTFNINFFIIVEPGVLEDAPQFRVGNVALPKGSEQRVQDALAVHFPNVVLIRIREVLEKVASVLARLGLAVRLLGGFTVLAGLAILAGAVSASSVRRGREVALLKTLGMTRRGVAAVFAVEYGLIGLVAGAIGACGAGVLATLVQRYVLDLPPQLGVLPFVVGIAGTVLLSVLAGLLASGRALARRPADVLRSL